MQIIHSSLWEFKYLMEKWINNTGMPFKYKIEWEHTGRTKWCAKSSAMLMLIQAENTADDLVMWSLRSGRDPSVYLAIHPSLSGHAPPAGSCCRFVLVSADLVIDRQRSLISDSQGPENAGGKWGWLVGKAMECGFCCSDRVVAESFRTVSLPFLGNRMQNATLN